MPAMEEPNRSCPLSPEQMNSHSEMKNTDTVDLTTNDVSSYSSSDDSRDFQSTSSTEYLFQRVSKSNRRKYRVIVSLVLIVALVATAVTVISVTVKKMTSDKTASPHHNQGDSLRFDRNTLAPDQTITSVGDQTPLLSPAITPNGDGNPGLIFSFPTPLNGKKPNIPTIKPTRVPSIKPTGTNEAAGFFQDYQMPVALRKPTGQPVTRITMPPSLQSTMNDDGVDNDDDAFAYATTGPTFRRTFKPTRKSPVASTLMPSIHHTSVDANSRETSRPTYRPQSNSQPTLVPVTSILSPVITTDIAHDHNNNTT